MNALQLPAALHFCVTRPNTRPGRGRGVPRGLCRVGRGLRPGATPARRLPAARCTASADTPQGNQTINLLMSGVLDAMHESWHPSDPVDPRDRPGHRRPEGRASVDPTARSAVRHSGRSRSTSASTARPPRTRRVGRGPAGRGRQALIAERCRSTICTRSASPGSGAPRSRSAPTTTRRVRCILWADTRARELRRAHHRRTDLRQRLRPAQGAAVGADQRRRAQPLRAPTRPATPCCCSTNCPRSAQRCRVLLEPVDYVAFRLTGRAVATPASMIAVLADRQPASAPSRRTSTTWSAAPEPATRTAAGADPHGLDPGPAAARTRRATRAQARRPGGLRHPGHPRSDRGQRRGRAVRHPHGRVDDGVAVGAGARSRRTDILALDHHHAAG